MSEYCISEYLCLKIHQNGQREILFRDARILFRTASCLLQFTVYK